MVKIHTTLNLADILTKTVLGKTLEKDLVFVKVRRFHATRGCLDGRAGSATAPGPRGPIFFLQFVCIFNKQKSKYKYF